MAGEGEIEVCPGTAPGVCSVGVALVDTPTGAAAAPDTAGGEVPVDAAGGSAVGGVTPAAFGAAGPLSGDRGPVGVAGCAAAGLAPGGGNAPEGPGVAVTPGADEGWLAEGPGVTGVVLAALAGPAGVASVAGAAVGGVAPAGAMVLVEGALLSPAAGSLAPGSYPRAPVIVVGKEGEGRPVGGGAPAFSVVMVVVSGDGPDGGLPAGGG
jgi:hypothetical protein